MHEPDDTLSALREALTISPDNIPLRTQLARLLIRRGLLDEADSLLHDGLAAAPHSEALKLALARCSHAQGKHSVALVIVEQLITRPDAPADAHLLHARLLLRRGELDASRRAYLRALSLDASLADPDLAEAVGADSKRPPHRRPDPAPTWHPDPNINSDPESEDSDDDNRIRLRRDDDDSDSAPFVEMEKPGIRFADVGGMDPVKDQVRLKIIEPLRNPALYAAYGKAAGGGVLLYGPPGCGKTHLARATAGEVDAAFISVGLHDVLDMFIGGSEQKLHALFEHARSNTPCVLFFDEADALGAKRSDMRQSAGRSVINQFLAELDGVETSNEGVLILAATNSPWHLDPAFRRPGRFDRIIFVPPPDPPGRAAILRVLLKGKPQEPIDADHVAARTDRFSGADLKAVVDRAVEEKLSEALRSGRPSPLTHKDLLRAAKSVKPSTSEWFATARNHALYANEGGDYDEILHYLKLK